MSVYVLFGHRNGVDRHPLSSCLTGEWKLLIIEVRIFSTRGDDSARD